MKKLLIILLCFSVIFIGCVNPPPNKSEDMFSNDTDITNKASSQKDFMLSEGFIKADDETFLSILIDAQGLVNLSAQERSENLIRWKKNTEIYIKENSNNYEENIIINKSPLTPSQNILDMFKEQIENQSNQLLANGIEFKLTNSGFGKFHDMFEYIFFKSKLNIDGLHRYSCQYIISVNNQGYHIVVNTVEGLGIDDVFTAIN
jgi:hypothetical protein